MWLKVFSSDSEPNIYSFNNKNTSLPKFIFFGVNICYKKYKGHKRRGSAPLSKHIACYPLLTPGRQAFMGFLGCTSLRALAYPAPSAWNVRAPQLPCFTQVSAQMSLLRGVPDPQLKTLHPIHITSPLSGLHLSPHF